MYITNSPSIRKTKMEQILSVIVDGVAIFIGGTGVNGETN